MTNNIKILLLITGVLLLLISCGGPTGTSSGGEFEGVPSGEIVSIELRDSVLTGMNISESLNKGSTYAQEAQKWWLHIISEIDYTNCEGLEDSTITKDDAYFAFKPSGSLYYKIGKNGTEHRVSEWEWTDESKTAISLGNYPDIEFELRSLNNEEVVYASEQISGQCRVLTWEQFQEPFVEEKETDIPVTYDMQWNIDVNETLVDTLVADSAANFTFMIENYPQNGTLDLIDQSTGIFSYQPNQDFVGDDSFTFSASNNAGRSNVSTADISVEGEMSNAENNFTYHGTTYELSWGYIEDYGAQTGGFRNYDFILTEQEENWILEGDTTGTISSNHAIIFWFESLGEESFDEGTYYFSDETVQANHLHYGQLMFFDGSSSGVNLEVVAGAVEISISGDVYTLLFDLTLDNGNSLQGSFSYPFTIIDETSEPTAGKSLVPKLQ